MPEKFDVFELIDTEKIGSDKKYPMIAFQGDKTREGRIWYVF